VLVNIERVDAESLFLFGNLNVKNRGREKKYIEKGNCKGTLEAAAGCIRGLSMIRISKESNTKE